MKRTHIARSPFHWAHAVVGLLSGGAAGWLATHERWLVVAVWLLLLTIITFAVFGVDKSRAQRGIHRVAEATLLWWTALGGTIGAALAINFLRHKTQKPAFLRPLWLIVGCQMLGIVAAFIFKQVK